MAQTKPKQINIYNLNYFFQFNPSNISGIKPGMLIQFTYKNNKGVIHDKAPLVYVTDVQGDRLWGLNLHYEFKLMQPLIEVKQKELLQVTQPKTPTLKDTVKEKEGVLPDVKVPQPLLESFTLNQKPEFILRNYLYTRMGSLKKLSYIP